MDTSLKPWLAAHPAPLVFAELACHVLTTCVLLNRDIAFGAPLCVFALSPLLQQLLLRLLAPLALMPRHDALKAKVFLAPVAPHLLGGRLFYLNHDVLALWVRTELLEIASHDLLVRTESQELLVSLIICELVNETVRHILAAAGLRAFHVEALIA